jgi:CRISPR-associated endonuclease/helicase Cas3
MAQQLHELDNGRRGRPGRRALMQLAGITLSQGGKTLPEEKAQTRYNEEESLTTLLVRAVEPQPAAKRTCITFLDGREVHLPWRRCDLDRQSWRRLSIELTRQTLTLRPRECPPPESREQLEQLGFGHCFYLGFPDQGESVLRLGVVDAFGRITGEEGGKRESNETLIYREDIGFRREK